MGKTNTSCEAPRRMTLRAYYLSLPEASEIAPRKKLIHRIMERCQVPYSTARSWLLYQIMPRNEEFLKVLSEETGIAIEDLYIKEDDDKALSNS